MKQTDSVDFWKFYKENINTIHISDDFKCSYCKIIVTEPYLISCSECHVFCLDCLNDITIFEKKICKICKEEIDSYTLDKRTIKKMSDFQIQCLNSNHCIWKGNLKDFENHSKKCEFIFVPCGLNCQDKIRKNEMTFHLENVCKERIIKCEYCGFAEKSKNHSKHQNEECLEIPLYCPNECNTNEVKTRIKRRNLENHLENCNNKNMSCIICNQMVNRIEMENHVKKNIYSHILTITQEVNFLKKQIERNNKQMSENNQEISKLKETIANLRNENFSQNKKIINLKEEHDEKINKEVKDLVNVEPLQEKIKLDHGSRVWGLLQFSEELIISGGFKDIKFWNTRNYKLIDSIDDAHSDYVNKIIKLNDKNFVSGSDDYAIKIWDLEKRVAVKEFKEHEDSISDLLILSDLTIASSSNDKSIKIWNSNNDRSIQTLKGHSSIVICLLEMNKNEIISGSDDKTIKFWNLEKKNFTNTLPPQNNGIYSLLKINDSQFASGSKELKIWDYPSGDCQKTFQNNKFIIRCLILVESDVIATGSDDKSIKIWNISNGEIINNLIMHTSNVNRLIRLNKYDISSGSDDKSVIIWKGFKQLK